MIPWLEPGDPFPPVDRALVEPNGLLCAGGDLGMARLLDAYRNGIFPWYSGHDPILWWSPNPRMVLRTDALRVSRSLAKSRRNRGYEVRADTAFAAVVDRAGVQQRADDVEILASTDGWRSSMCGERGTWLGDAMRAAYLGLHDAGIAHSIETWCEGRLVGGLYGLSIGRMFYGESMFSRATDASKVALATLVDWLRARGCPIIDCQMNTPLLASLGAREVPRSAFLREVAALVNYPQPLTRWRDLAVSGESTRCPA